ncbi:cytochrome c biogenesis protein CcsA [Sporomusa acidovorans]|uniref:Cytochrome c-type biogenesis protein CcmF n=1 Tax=Sporomusa acidovorans (strain ATCC 49682 / DSM 3132 / Mol) TaxID=1123286 RepID=A0ABZ3IZV2_SPOA4|nr:cytochrome c biogenesis protein CcsA [Sporomusa acidovorans]OZC21396.1 cytochrome c-type biogenesis protein CcmF [Sporomusa acidovorans DSM 3132]SDE55367.1 cytochrome c-type biogenesis protein CcmF [Sporomusa acidovorans]
MIGVISLFLGCICSIAALFSAISRYSRAKLLPNCAKISAFSVFLYQLSAIFSILAAAFLVYAILTDQFQYNYVWSYSAASLPLFYKLAVFWAGQEGSFLLWLLFHSLIGLYLLKKGYLPKPAFIAYCMVQTVLHIILLLKNPFLLHPGPFTESMGLNPLLQDFWMVIHPPLIFMGYALLAVPFALAIGGLIANKPKELIEHALPWSMLAWGFLGSGIFLGAYWAYKTLGWGGYWSWDPVENASLIPWLTCTALIHFLFIAHKKAGAYRAAYFCAIYTFILVLYGTYLTRSGVLSDFSVHSFSQDSSASMLAMLMLSLGVMATVILIIKWRLLPAVPLYQSFYSREFSLAAGGVTLLGLAGLILLGTSAPLITQLFGSPQSIDPGFYNRSTLPLTVILLVFTNLSLLHNWNQGKLKSKKYYLALLPSLFLGLLFCSCYSIFQPLAILVTGLSFVLIAIHASLLVKKRLIAASLSHMGLGFLCIGILVTSLASEKTTVSLQPQQAVSIFGQAIEYTGSTAKKSAQQKIESFKIDQGKYIYAVTKYSADGRASAHEPAILKTLRGDLYLTPSQSNTEKRQVRLALDTPQTLDHMTFTLKNILVDKQAADSLKITVQVLVETKNTENMYTLEMVQQDGKFHALPRKISDTCQLSLQSLNTNTKEISLRIDVLPQDNRNIDVEISFKPLMWLVWLGCLFIIAGILTKVFVSKKNYSL